MVPYAEINHAQSPDVFGGTSDASGWTAGLQFPILFGKAREVQDATIKTAELTEALYRRDEIATISAAAAHRAEPIGGGSTGAVTVNVGDPSDDPAATIEMSESTVDKVTDALTDTSVGAYGIPNMVWFALVFAVALLVLWKTGVLSKLRRRS